LTADSHALPRSDAEIWHDLECGAYTADLDLWQRLATEVTAERGRCRVLELGAGAGRVALELALLGCRVTALDSDTEMVAVLRRRARGLAIEVVVGDARRFELQKRFDLALAPMQLTQLLSGADERIAMLTAIARHLDDRGRAALALLDLDESWEAEQEEAPIPDMAEVGGCVYASQPVAVRRVGRERRLELDRVRRIVSPDGEIRESFDRVRLELVDAGRLEQEGRRAGLAPRGRVTIPATAHHVGSTVVFLERHG
jgi:SAM-dependent methyltransferase